jgi:hypothetical protein
VAAAFGVVLNFVKRQQKNKGRLIWWVDFAWPPDLMLKPGGKNKMDPPRGRLISPGPA